MSSMQVEFSIWKEVLNILFDLDKIRSVLPDNDKK